jgi:hypothetical protein
MFFRFSMNKRVIIYVGILGFEVFELKISFYRFWAVTTRRGELVLAMTSKNH